MEAMQSLALYVSEGREQQVPTPRAWVLYEILIGMAGSS
jgi:hypothetical protein